MITEWKVLVNGTINNITSDKFDVQDQFKDIKKKVYKKIGVNKKTIVKPEIYIINRV